MTRQRAVRLTSCLWLVAGFTGTLPAHAQQPPRPAAETRPGIAVLPFLNGGSFGREREDFTALEVGMQQILTTELSQNAALLVIDRSVLRQLLEEQDLGASGRVDDRTAVRVGRLLGVRYVVKGGFSDVWGTLRIDGHVVDVETGKVIRGVEVTDKREQIHRLLVELAARLTRTLELPELPEATLEARRSRQLPVTALELFSHAQVFADLGQADRAIHLYRRIMAEYPQMTEAESALRKLTDGG